MTIKTILRWLTYLLLFFVALVILCAATIRFFIFPNIDQYKNTIADYASKTIDRKVSIGEIQTGWHHLSPQVTLSNIHIYDEQNRPALFLKQIDTELSWLSIGMLDLRLSELTAHEPTLIIRRTKENIFYLAGINISGRGNPDFANWLLSQSHVSILNAEVTYIDELRQAPPLSLHQLDASLSNAAWRSLLGRHQFSMNATPSIGSSTPIKLDGYFIGRNINKLADWYGEIHTQLKDTDLATWRPWINYPIVLQKGTGNAEARLHFSHLTIDKVDADLNMKDISIVTKDQENPLTIKHMNGTLSWSNIKNRQSLSAKNVDFSLENGMQIKAANGLFARSTKNNKPWIEANISINKLQLDALKKTLLYFPVPEQWSQYIDGLSPSGDIAALKASIEGDANAPEKYDIAAKFNQLSMAAYNKIPGFSKLTGEITADQVHGKLKLNTAQAMIDLKGILRWPIPANQLTGEITWDKRNQDWVIKADEVYITSPHITGTVNGLYELNHEASDYIDFKGKFSKADAKTALFYYPTSLSEDTLHWLDTSILKGDLSDIDVVIKGKTADFPFVDKYNRPDKKLGILKATATLSNALIDYGQDWPPVEDLTTSMLFESTRMELNAKKGRILGQKIVSSHIEIPQLDADWPILKAISVAESPVTEGIRFVNNSPVKKVTLGFTDNLKTAGDARLELELTVPLQNVDSTKFKGAYQIKNGTIFADSNIGMPQLDHLNGTLRFTESNLYAQNITTEVAGGPAQFNLSTDKDKTIRINASGNATDAGIKKEFPLEILRPIQGQADWNGEIIIKKPLVNIAIQSNLVGMKINLPTPFNKASSEAIPFTFEKKQTAPNEDSLLVHYDKLLSAKLMRTEVNNQYSIERGSIGINMPPELPNRRGILLNASLDQVDADEWLTYFNQGTSANGENGANQINQANLSIQTLNIFNRNIHNLKLTAQPSANGIAMAIQGQEINGNAEWINANNGKIIANLKNLTIPKIPEAQEPVQKKEIRRLAKQYPALDITVENFEMGDKKFGTLALNAYENENDWIIQKLNISNPDNTLTADGTWHNWSRNPNTSLRFNLQTQNIGNTLIRFGQPDMVKGGKATITGQLQWPGSPHEFETSGLSGNFKLDAEKGQILKVQPGVGRLLGLISLQSLPRRLTLDFRDLFSDGFAFDKISANATATNGILRSNDFFMTGPAAETKIKGETNLTTETQNFKVKVIPHVTDSLSLAALAGGPIAGAAAFVAQKILKDPLNKIASTEYVITGTWDNPQEVESNKETNPKQAPKKSLQH